MSDLLYSAIVADSGEKRGRSPKDKRIVEEETSCGDVWVRLLLLPNTIAYSQ